METVGKVFRAPDRKLGHLLDEARALGVSTILAAIGEPQATTRLMTPGGLQRIAGEGVVAGPAVTVWNPTGNNTMIRFGIESVELGDVLLVTCPSDAAAQWGELATEWAKARGVAGVIVDGSVRDVRDLRQLGVSVWARSIDPRQAFKVSPGYVNAPVLVQGTRICAGDLVVADDDGILALPAALAPQALQLARTRADSEGQVREDAKAGKTSPFLARIFSGQSIEVVDQTWAEVESSGQ
jgi:4-hydroxy-4-methyl-2-oxoglutarate aldolase